MLRHIVIWNYADSFTEQENINNAKKMKEEIENLKNIIEEIVSIEVIINPLPTSNGDIMLDSKFKNEEDLKVYQDNPEHKKLLSFISNITRDRKCIDYFE